MQALVLHPPRNFFPYGSDSVAQARALYSQRLYVTGNRIDMPDCKLEGEEAAEECFDVTNNPSRQDEREAVYGLHRSVSVGDIVIIENTGGAYYCASTAWVQIE